jgi:hypothetical protein
MHDWLRKSQTLAFETTFHVSNRVQGGLNQRGTVKYQIQKPNSFRVDLQSGGKRHILVSDGSTMTIYHPARKVYATLEASDSIVGTMYKAIGALTLQARMIEFFWTVDYLAATGEDVQVTAFGGEKIRGKSCQKYRVKRFEEEWDVWIERSGTPYLCKLVSRTTDQTAFTVQTNIFSWNKQPQFKSGLFNFKPPAGTRQVHVSEIE